MRIVQGSRTRETAFWGNPAGKAVDLHGSIKDGGTVVRDGGRIDFVDPALRGFSSREEECATLVKRGMIEEGAAVPENGLQFAHIMRQAAPVYNISPNPEDYVLVPVPIIITDVPNANGTAFPAKEMVSFIPESGCLSYRSWVGKPTRLEHDDSGGYVTAKGIVLDTAMAPLAGCDGFWRVSALLAFDRTKDPGLAGSILSGHMNAYSMGSLVAHFSCSVCGATGWKNKPGMQRPCQHICLSPNTINFHRSYGGAGDGNAARVVYVQAHNIMGVEVSAVATPAWMTALSDHVTPLKRSGE